jgi:hypothetical protein
VGLCQVGGSWRQPQVTAEQPDVASDARRPPIDAHVGESRCHRTSAPLRPAQASGLPSRLITSWGVLAAALALAGGLAVLAARGRPGRPGSDRRPDHGNDHAT